jgi:hypothetical protein
VGLGLGRDRRQAECQCRRNNDSAEFHGIALQLSVPFAREGKPTEGMAIAHGTCLIRLDKYNGRLRCVDGHLPA